MSQQSNRIREHRKRRGMTLEKLAEKAGCGVTMLSDLERGNRQLTQHWMKVIARALKLKPIDLMPADDTRDSLSVDERDLVYRYRLASPDQQSQIRAIVDVLLR